MTNPFHVLVVGVSNDSRSALAERLLRHRLDEVLGQSSRAVHVSSAGARAAEGAPMHPLAARELQRLGGTPDGFASRHLDRRMMQRADLVLTVTRAVRSRVLEDEPMALRRTFTLRELAALTALLPWPGSPEVFVADAAAHRWAARLEDHDIADPRGSRRRHREAADLVAEACDAVTTLWTGRPAASGLAV